MNKIYGITGYLSKLESYSRGEKYNKLKYLSGNIYHVFIYIYIYIYIHAVKNNVHFDSFIMIGVTNSFTVPPTYTYPHAQTHAHTHTRTHTHTHAHTETHILLCR